MKSFSQFREETTKTVTFASGRFNPPTVGHEKLLDKVKQTAKGGDFFIFPSQSEDPKKNPLPFELKGKYLKKMFPKYAKNIDIDRAIKTPLDAIIKLYDMGYTKAQLVVGSDRLKAFEFLVKYNGVESNGKYYNFPDGIHLISAGARDPDADDVVSAMSASKLRAAAADGDLKLFSTGMPRGFNDVEKLLNDIRKGMNMPVIKSFREHVQLPKKSDVRELYVANEIFRLGETVCSIKTNIRFVIKERKTNYVVDYSGKRYFISDLIPIS